MNHAPRTIQIVKWAVLAGVGIALSGCGILYTNVRFPYAYNSATPFDVKASKDDPLTTARACSQSVLYLFAWGDTGFASLSKQALAPYPQSTLYDVKVDIKLNSYLLGLYTKSCTSLTAKVAKP